MSNELKFKKIKSQNKQRQSVIKKYLSEWKILAPTGGTGQRKRCGT